MTWRLFGPLGCLRPLGLPIGRPWICTPCIGVDMSLFDVVFPLCMYHPAPADGYHTWSTSRVWRWYPFTSRFKVRWCCSFIDGALSSPTPLHFSCLWRIVTAAESKAPLNTQPVVPSLNSRFWRAGCLDVEGSVMVRSTSRARRLVACFVRPGPLVFMKSAGVCCGASTCFHRPAFSDFQHLTANRTTTGGRLEDAWWFEAVGFGLTLWRGGSSHMPYPSSQALLHRRTRPVHREGAVWYQYCSCSSSGGPLFRTTILDACESSTHANSQVVCTRLAARSLA